MVARREANFYHRSRETRKEPPEAKEEEEKKGRAKREGNRGTAGESDHLRSHCGRCGVPEYLSREVALTRDPLLEYAFCFGNTTSYS